MKGTKPELKFNGGRGLAPELKKTGVLWAGDKIAVLPGYPCDVTQNANCYSEIDQLEQSLSDAGFWVVPWRELRSSLAENRFARVKERGIEHALLVDRFAIQRGRPGGFSVGSISLIEQDEAKTPRPLRLKPDEWKVVGPRCVKHFGRQLTDHHSAPHASISVRLISVSPERVLWTKKIEYRPADSAADLELVQDVPKTVKKNKVQRFWGLGMAGVGVALGVGAAAGAKNMSTGSTLVMAGIALISAGLGGWLIYDARPREVHPKGPLDILCNPAFGKDSDKRAAQLASSRFEVQAGASSKAPASAQAVAKAQELQALLVNDVARRVTLLQRPKWKKLKKKKKSSKSDGNDLAALSCRWEKQVLRCKPACTRCEDPWEGPCEICRPGKVKKKSKEDGEKSTAMKERWLLVSDSEPSKKEKNSAKKEDDAPSTKRSGKKNQTKTKVESEPSSKKTEPSDPVVPSVVDKKTDAPSSKSGKKDEAAASQASNAEDKKSKKPKKQAKAKKKS